MLAPDDLAAIARWCEAERVQLISDEIYHGIEYAPEPLARSAWETSREAVVFSSFSKYFSMTGWRIGWMLVPPRLRRAVDVLTGNFTICPPVLAQRAALAAFTDASYAELDGHVRRYAANRSLLLDGLPRFGIDRLAPADGAFYVYADVRHLTSDSMALCHELLSTTGVATAPGIDFDTVDGHAHAADELRRLLRRDHHGPGPARGLAGPPVRTTSLTSAAAGRPAGISLPVPWFSAQRPGKEHRDRRGDPCTATPPRCASAPPSSAIRAPTSVPWPTASSPSSRGCGGRDGPPPISGPASTTAPPTCATAPGSTRPPPRRSRSTSTSATRLKDAISGTERKASSLVADARTRIASLRSHDDPAGVTREPTDTDRLLDQFVPPKPGHKDWLSVTLPGL